jgi:hypothetical protein
VRKSKGIILVKKVIRNSMEMCNIMIEISKQGNSKWEMEDKGKVLMNN